MKRLLTIFTFWLSIWTLAAQEQMVEQLNLFRSRHGLGELAPDPRLTRAAGRYAEALLYRQRLSHRDAEGGTALERLHAAGGTAVVVGEILGSGPDAVSVLRAWRDSERHLRIMLKADWTHLGVGMAAGRGIWVALFCTCRVKNLTLVREPGGYLLTGDFIPPDAREPFLWSGLTRLSPELWDPAGRTFRYRISPEAGSLYHRLGYLSREGEPVLTDVFYPEELITFSPIPEPR